MSLGVEVVEHLTQIYEGIANEEDNQHVSEFESLTRRFTSKYKSAPFFFVRVPGLLNIFGEDPSYTGYSPCSVAIDRDLLIACSPNPSSKDIEINSIASLQFPPKTFTYESNFNEAGKIDSSYYITLSDATFYQIPSVMSP